MHVLTGRLDALAFVMLAGLAVASVLIAYLAVRGYG
jgi:hypothetical protein